MRCEYCGTTSLVVTRVLSGVTKNVCFPCLQNLLATQSVEYRPLSLDERMREYCQNDPMVSDLVINLVSDPVLKPSHYTFGKFEVIDVLEDWFPTDPLLFNVGKYIARAAHKGHELEDLKKARFYLERRIARLESPVAGSAP